MSWRRALWPWLLVGALGAAGMVARRGVAARGGATLRADPGGAMSWRRALWPWLLVGALGAAGTVASAAWLRAAALPCAPILEAR